MMAFNSMNTETREEMAMRFQDAEDDLNIDSYGSLEDQNERRNQDVSATRFQMLASYMKNTKSRENHLT